PNYRSLIAGRMGLAVHRQHGDGNFQHDRVHVEARDCVGSEVVLVVVVFLFAHHASDSHAKVQGVKRRAQVDVEGIIYRPGEHSHTVAQVVDPLLEQGVVIGHGARAYIGRHGVEGLSTVQVGMLTVLHHGDGVVLPQAQTFGTRPVQRSNRWDAGDTPDKPREHIGQAYLRGETELKRNVLDAVEIVVNLHFVQYIGV